MVGNERDVYRRRGDVTGSTAALRLRAIYLLSRPSGLYGSFFTSC